MWDLIVSVPDHCVSFYFRFYCNKSKSDITELYCVVFLSIDMLALYKYFPVKLIA